MSQKKKKLADVVEELDAMGQEDEKKAAKFVIEKGKEDRHEEDEKRSEVEWKLHDNKGRIFTYKDLLLNEFKRQMMEMYQMLPQGYAWMPFATKKGIALYIKDEQDKWYARGMIVSGIPKYDLNCVERMINKALDSMENLRAQYEARREAKKPKEKKSKGGIILS
jgi:hypothetical protein